MLTYRSKLMQIRIRYKEHTQYITSNNPQSAYTDHILSNIHEYGPIETTMTLLQSTHKGKRINTLQNYYVHFFQYNNRILPEPSHKKRNQRLNWFETYIIHMYNSHPSCVSTQNWPVSSHPSYYVQLDHSNGYVLIMTTVLPNSHSRVCVCNFKLQLYLFKWYFYFTFIFILLTEC
jgi:hypothetical protein